MVTVNTLLANRKNYGTKRSLSVIRYIVIHYTANEGDSAKNNALYFMRNVLGTSAHYFVDANEIYQSVLDNYAANAVGGHRYKTDGGSLYGVCKNYNSISIELCDSIDRIPDAVANNAIVLIRAKMEQYGIPIENVVRHYDVTGKPCPRPLVEELAWLKFKGKITEGAIDMEKIAELEKRIEKLEEAAAVYDYIDDNMPKWIQEITRWALDNGIIQGTGEGLGMTKAKAEMLVATKNAFENLYSN